LFLVPVDEELFLVPVDEELFLVSAAESPLVSAEESLLVFFVVKQTVAFSSLIRFFRYQQKKSL
jgi:hypothetical protein